MMSRKRPLLATAALYCCFYAAHAVGVPGTLTSESGFDTVGGSDPLCWLGRSSQAYSDVVGSILESTKQTIQNPLVQNFTIVGNVQLYPSCPQGTSLQVEIPTSLSSGNAATRRNYSFSISGSLDLREWPSDLIVTDDPNKFDAIVHVVLCEMQNTGFCSPFVHYYSSSSNQQQFGDVHDTTHVDSDYVTIPVIPDQVYDFQVDVPVRVNEPGVFSVVAGILFFLSDISSFAEPLYMASVGAIPLNQTHVLEFRSEPDVLTTSRAAEIASYVLIGIGGCILLFLMFQLIRHRKDKVITLTQGKFLVAMCFFGIIAMAGSIFFNPKSDLYCNMLGPMVVIPLHIFYSIILGRLWRINAIISPLLLLTLDKEQTFTTRCVNWLSKMTTCRRNESSLRRTVTDAQLARVVTLWALPQIILQICNWLLNPDQSIVIFNQDMTKASTVCSGIYNNGVPEILSAVLLVIQFVAMWILARKSQDLPSLFNEASAIFDVTLVSILILAIATIVIIMTSGPATSPSVMYIIGVLATLIMILNASIKLVLPKLQMVWRGDTVVVTKLIFDHQKEQRKKSSIILYNQDDLPIDPKTVPTEDDSSDTSSVVLVHATVDDSIGISELDDVEDEFRRSVHSSGGLEPIAEAFDSMNSIALDLSTVRANGELPKTTTDPKSTEFRANHKLTTRDPPGRPTLMVSPHSVHNFTRSKRTIVAGGSVEAPSLTTKQSKSMRTGLTSKQTPGFKSMRNGMTAALGSMRNLATDVAMGTKSTDHKGGGGGDAFQIDYAPHVEEKIKISETEPPSRRLLLRMIDVQRLLKQVNTTLLAGSVVPREEWDLIRDAAIELGGVFEDDVEFSWDETTRVQDASFGIESRSNTTARRRRSSTASTHSRQGRIIVKKWSSM